jgi:hypothetical protein
MQNENTVQLRRVRDLGQNISDTFTFLKENWKPLYSAIGVVGLPPLVILTLLLKYGMDRFDPAAIEAGDLNFVGGITLLAVLAYLVMIFVYLMCFSMVNEYIRAYAQGEHVGITTKDLLSRGFSELGSYFGLAFLSGLMIIVGMFLCFLPGIYLAIVLMIAPCCHAMERAGASGSISRAFALMKDNWWETFALVIIMVIIQWVIQQVLTMPVTTMLGISPFLGFSPDPSDPQALLRMMRTTLPLIMVLSLGAGMITYPIGSVSAAMRYFTLVEMKEAVGLGEDVKRFDQL